MLHITMFRCERREKYLEENCNVPCGLLRMSIHLEKDKTKGIPFTGKIDQIEDKLKIYCDT